MFKSIIDNKSSEDSKKHFNQILRFAQSIIVETENSLQSTERKLDFESHPIIDVIRLVGRKIQTECLTNPLYYKNDPSSLRISAAKLFFDTNISLTKSGKIFYNFKKKVFSNKQVSLGRDLVLPWPWEISRLITCIANIGVGRIEGAWKQDENHYIELWLPMGIAWVEGGNHSIATGIIQGSGNIKPEVVYDISDIYDHVYTDGINYVRKEDHSIISPVTNVEFAAIFEIGRIMKSKSISF